MIHIKIDIPIDGHLFLSIDYDLFLRNVEAALNSNFELNLPTNDGRFFSITTVSVVDGCHILVSKIYTFSFSSDS